MSNTIKELYLAYEALKPDIKNRLKSFKQVPHNNYFYELCFCIMTPQSKAENALLVQQKLEALDFFNNEIDPIYLLEDKSHYIRFHNQKSIRLLLLKTRWSEIENTLSSDINNFTKRGWLVNNINGIGMKESSHFLRNIGYSNLAILDRHILKNLVCNGVFNSIPKISSKKQYLSVEQAFIKFAGEVNISMDELDLLFWAKEAGNILK